MFSAPLLSALALLSGDEKVTVKTELVKPPAPAVGRPAGPAGPMVNAGSRSLRFSDKVPSGLKAPAMANGTYAQIDLGGKKIGFAVDMAAEAKEATLGIDADGNGEITAQETRKVEVVTKEREGRNGQTTKTTTLAQNETIKLLGGELNLNLMVTPRGISGQVAAQGYRKGTAKVGETEYTLVVIDSDMDGKFASKGDFFGFMTSEDFNDKEKTRSLGDRNGRMFECYEPAIVGDKRAWLAAGADGAFTVTLGAPKEPVGDYLHRRTERVNKDWWESFAPTADQFNEQQKIDTSKAKAKKQAHWSHTLDLEPVLAQAKKENKPVLIDFETDWCVWCKRFDFFTYPYADVAERLEKFVTVKFNCELDTKGIVKSYGVSGFPSLAVLTPDGKPLKFEVKDQRSGDTKIVDVKSGFLPPEKMVAFLDECLERASKGQIEPASATKEPAKEKDGEAKEKGGVK